MTTELVIGDRMYSSWSLRAWLLFDMFEIPVKTHLAPMLTEEFHATLARFAPARLVPVIRYKGHVVSDTLAIAETLAEDFRQLWPSDPARKALARSLAAEMHSGFPDLRNACPMNLRTAFEFEEVSTGVASDLARLEELWARARAAAPDGPWLLGPYSIADAMFAPVAARIAGYGLPVSEDANAYVNAHIASGSFRRWRAMAFASDQKLARYEENGLQRKPWPGPAVIEAEAITDGNAENDLCPFSGTKVQPDSLARISGKIIGFCNMFCRDKAVADPAAWPKLAPMLP